MRGHKGEELKGKAKQVIGKAMGDEKMQIEGTVERASAVVKRTAEDVVHKVEHIAKPHGH